MFTTLKRKAAVAACVLTVIMLLGAVLVALNAGASTATRTPSATIDSISLEGDQAGAPGYEYANQTMGVMVVLTNGDTTLKAGATLDCTIFVDDTTTVEHQFTQYVFAQKLLPGEEAVVEFSTWDPSKEGVYNISVAFSGTSFTLVQVADSDNIKVEVKDVVDLGAYIAPQVFDEANDKDTKAYLENTQLTPRVMLQKKGNLVPPPQSVFFTVYDNTASQNVSGLEDIETHNLGIGWQSLTPIAAGLPAGDYNIHVWFENYTALDFNITFATDSGSEAVEVSAFNYYEGETIPSGDVDVTATVKNCGNSAWTTLDPMLIIYATSDATNACVYFEKVGNIKTITGVITPAGSVEEFSFATFQLSEGSYHINVSAKDTAGNTTVYSFLNRSVVVQDRDAELATWFEQPFNAGVYDLEDAGVGINITLLGPNYAQGSVKVDGEVTDAADQPVAVLTQRSFDFTSDLSDRPVLWTFAPTGPGNFKAKAWLNGTSLKTEVSFKVGIKPNGTVSGTVAGAPAGLDVTISNNTKLFKTVQTDASGDFDFGAPGLAEGVYKVEADGGYYYTDAVNNSVAVAAGTNTVVGGLAVTAYDTGMVNVTCNLEGATITIDGVLTGTTTKQDEKILATFDAVVVGTVNVSAEKLHYDTVWNDSVVVVKGNVTEVTLELEPTPLPVITSPADGAQDVELDTYVGVAFQEEVTLTSVQASVFLYQGTTDVTKGITTTDNRTFTLGHDPLDHSSHYMIKVGKNVENKTGAKPLWMDFSSTFTTLDRPDAVVTGWVTDLTGSAVSGAEVYFKEFTTTSGTDGSYSLPVKMDVAALANQTLHANGRASGFGKANTTADLVSGQTAVNVNFTLDKLPPEVTLKPADGAQGVALDGDIELRFNFPLNTTLMLDSLNATERVLNQTFFEELLTLEDGAGAQVPGVFSVSMDNRSITFDPAGNLSEETQFTLTIEPLLYYADDTLGKPIYWQFNSGFKTLALPKAITLAAYSPTGTEVAVNESIRITFSLAFDHEQLEDAFKLSPTVAGLVFNWTGNTSVVISHKGFDYATLYTVTIHELPNVAEGYYLQKTAWNFTTTAEEELNYTIEVGPVKNEDGDPVEGALVEATTPAGTVYKAETDENGTAKFTGMPWPDFPDGTKFKATHDDYKDPIEWELGEDIPEFKRGTLPTFIFIVIGVILLVVLVVVIVVILYGGKKEEEELVAAPEEGQQECPNCGAKAGPEATSCPECGESFEEGGHRCPECGSKVDQDSTTCDECGAEFDEMEE